MPAFTLDEKSVEAIRALIAKEVRERIMLELPQRKRNRDVDDWQYPLILGKTTTAHDKGNTEDVDLYGKFGETQGSETVLTAGSSNRSISVYNRFANVETGKWVLVIPTGSGFELIAAEC